MLIDARAVVETTSFACDLCIVGGGPAGIAIAERLRHTGLSIVLLESGGIEPELQSQNLYRGSNAGANYFSLDTCRFRLLGGSSNRWGGWCRPLERTDYERRDWIPYSGWPIDYSAVEPYFSDAATMLDLQDAAFDLTTWGPRLPTPFPLEGTNFENTFFQYSPETNFGLKYRETLSRAPNITAILHANLVDIGLDPDTQRVGTLRVAALSGRRFSVRPRAVVLAAGGIENARLLLASQRDRAAGLGNEHDTVGRYFMEHLHVPAGHFASAPTLPDRKFYRKTSYGGARVRGVMTVTAAAQAAHRLPSTTIAIEPASYSFGTPFLGVPPALAFGPIRLYRKLNGGRLGPVAGKLKANAEKAAGLSTRWRTWRASQAALGRAGLRVSQRRLYSLYFRSEQVPNPNSRVELSDQRDALGIPKVRLDWRIDPLDIETITAWLRVLASDALLHGLGQVIAPLETWPQEIIGGPHHMGTTRMSAAARDGVVDEHCRVHSVDNLYVAGASVFTTGGYANPTFTLVALALRLADTLHERLRSGYTVRSTS